jgi:gluconate 2-dehydrogenase gamma chain
MMTKPSDSEHLEPDRTPTSSLSRRSFLKGAGVAVTGVVGASVAGCGTPEPPHTLPGAVVRRVPMPQQYPSVPYPPPAPAAPGVLQFFSPTEAQVVEALTARILPGTPDDPGAREAGVVYYIDTMLAYQDGLPEPVYRHYPFAESYTGDEPPDSEFQIIWVPEEEIDRYGYQSVLTPRDVFRIGVAAVGRYAQQTFDQPFLELSEEQQDEIITALADNEATGFEPLTPESFFHALRRYTCEGMFSDPAYGGNRDMVGWRLIGYPGAQRAYTATEIQLEGSGLTREVWSMADLPHSHPGEPIGPNVVLPVSGSVEEHDHR